MTRLLTKEDRGIPIASDQVSIYTIEHSFGTEYAVTFPPVSGWELYSRLCSISRSDPGISDAYYDMDDMLRLGENDELKQKHANRLGVLWSTFFHSLPRQVVILRDDSNRESQDRKLAHTSDKFDKLTYLTNLQGEKFEAIAQEVEHMKKMLEEEIPTDTVYLKRVFRLEPRDIANSIKARTTEYGTTQKKILEAMKQLSDDERKQLTPYVLDAARRAVKSDSEVGSNTYDEQRVQRFAKYATKIPPKTMLVRNENSEYYLFPKPPFLRSVSEWMGEQEVYVCSEYIAVGVDESGKLFFPKEDLEEQAENIAKMRAGVADKHVIVPIVRFMRSNTGSTGFIFHEMGPELSETVLDDIGQRVDQSGKTIHTFENDWISGMVGIDMLVVANPSLKIIEDEWSTIWSKHQITFSEVMGEDPKPGEARQMNGPVQAGIIALQAFARYPGHFDHFVERVEEVAKRKAA